MRRLLIATFSLAAALALATPARAADFTWTATSGGLGATAVFHDAGGGLLQITLTNTGTGDVNAPSQVLTALLFSCNCGTLVPVSATTSGAVYLNGTALFGGSTSVNVGGEWAFNANGISSSGLDGLFGDANFNGTNLSGPTAVDGVQYGIVPSTEDGTGNGGIAGNEVIQHDVVFVLSGFNGDLSHVSNVSFQYGTSLTETNLGGGTGSGGGSGQTLVPEPTSLLLFGSGLAMTAYRARRKKQQKDQ